MSITQNKPLLAVLGAVVLAGLAWLAFGYFGIQAAFVDNEVSESGPTFAATTVVEEPSTDAEMQDEMQDEDPAIAEAEETNDEVQTLAAGSFSSDKDRYTVVGTANVLGNGTEQRFLRFEGFETTNGPDLKVYLRADDGEFVNLGELKGNIGDQNYEIPTNVDISVFSTVEIWCERFSVGFGSAELA